MLNNNRSVDFKNVISALLDETTPFPASYLAQFSDLETVDLNQLKEVWDQVSPDRRLELITTLIDVAEGDTLVCFDDFSRFALKDSDPRTRAAAIRLLWECKDSRLIPTFIRMTRDDEDPLVRAAAAAALGLFVYLGELEEISKASREQVEERLLGLVSAPGSPEVSLRALESLGFSGRDEVPPLIKKAYNTGDPGWVASSLIAMGRSVDPVWGKNVTNHLNDSRPDVQVEAVRAAGLLELTSARQPLIEILEHPDEIRLDVRNAAIWSLSQIGGESVRAVLEYISENTEDDSDTEYLEAALDNLEFTEGFPVFDLLEVDDEDDLPSVIDVDDDLVRQMYDDDEDEEEEDDDEDQY